MMVPMAAMHMAVLDLHGRGRAHFGDRALHFEEFFLGHYGAPGELAGGFPCLGCVGHGLPPPWWAWCFAASYWWLSRLDVGAKIGGPVKGVPASSLAGEDEGDGALC